MLFILVMEALSKMMGRAVLGGLIKGFKVAVSGVGKITHLQFAEDTLVCSDADGNQLDFPGQVLTWFKVVVSA